MLTTPGLSLAPLLGLVVPVLVMLALVAPGILLVVAVNTRGSDISGGSPLLPDAIADGRETVTPIFPDHVQAMLILVDLCRLLWVHQCALRIACVSQLCEDKPGCITRPAFAATGGVLPRHELDSAGIVAAPCARDFGTAGAVPRTAAHGTVKHRTGWLLGLVLLSQFQRGWGAPDTSLTGPLGSHVIGLPHFVPAVQKCSLQPVCDYATEGVRLQQTRPLPTPCRSQIGRGLRGVELDVGPTLLEQAVRLSGGKPYWEAATLLVVLSEHQSTDHRGVGCTTSGKGRSLSLSLCRNRSATPR